MINPDDLVTAWVVSLRNIRDLVAALGDNPANIQGYRDAFPFVGNLRRQILQMNPGSILVAWQGFAPVRLGNSGAWAYHHRFSLYLRAPESSQPTEGRAGGVSYGDLCSWIVNGAPEGSEVALQYADIHEGCDPFSRGGPSASRASLVVSADGETLDYFEFTAALVERSAF